MHNLKELREAQGLSQAALAAELGVCPQAVGKWERSESDPQWSMALKLTKALKCTLSDLFKSEPESGGDAKTA